MITRAEIVCVSLDFRRLIMCVIESRINLYHVFHCVLPIEMCTWWNTYSRCTCQWIHISNAIDDKTMLFKAEVKTSRIHCYWLMNVFNYRIYQRVCFRKLPLMTPKSGLLKRWSPIAGNGMSNIGKRKGGYRKKFLATVDSASMGLPEQVSLCIHWKELTF